MFKKFFKLATGAVVSLMVCNSTSVYALQPSPMSYPFPIEHYDQVISDWIKPDVSLDDKPLLTPQVQQAQFANFMKMLLRPWNDSYVESLVSTENLSAVVADQKTLLENKKKSSGRMSCDRASANFNASYPGEWADHLSEQVNLPQFNGKNSAQAKAIALDNLSMRALPTDDHSFADCNLPGEGDSFDYLQMSALWAGTPVYILGESLDKQWYYVRSPDVTGWVRSAGIKKVSDAFVDAWTKAASTSLVAINSPINAKHLDIVDEATQTKRFAGYIGAIFPADSNSTSDGAGYHILIPVSDSELPVKAYISKEDASNIPLALTRRSAERVMSNMQGRGYGWGSLNIDNPSDFLNDCSQEVKSFYTPFGIWLPRHSSAQVDSREMLGKIDLSYSKNPEERISKLMKEAELHPFTTIVYITGHIFIYLGNYENPNDIAHSSVPLTYQNLWGLRPLDQNGRYVIGKSVFFPLQVSYPEKYPSGDRELGSLASKPDFTVGFLDQLPDVSPAPMQLWNFGGKAHSPQLNAVDEWYSRQGAS